MGLILDASVPIAAERLGLSAKQFVRQLYERVGETSVALCAITVAELAHGICRARTPERRHRRRIFLDELKQEVPVHPVSAATAEIVGRVGGEQAERGINIPFGDLLIGACALELCYSVATSNVRHFRLIPGLHIVEL